MNDIRIPRVTAPIHWDEIPSIPLVNYPNYPAAPIEAEAKLCYDGDNLHVFMRAIEPNIRAENFGPMDAPCEDSCLEFFFQPTADDSRYFNIEFNPNGCMFLGFGHGRHDLVRLHPFTEQIIPEITRFDGGWQITYAIPYPFLKLFIPEFEGKSGCCLRGNFYKCGDLTVQRHYMTAFPIDPEKLDFHCPKFFHPFVFE